MTSQEERNHEQGEETDALVREFIEEADKAFGFPLNVVHEGGINAHMIESDHGYAVWVILPLTILHPTEGPQNATLHVEDAGEDQRRFTLTILSSYADPVMLIHEYFGPDHATFEISDEGKVFKAQGDSPRDDNPDNQTNSRMTAQSENMPNPVEILFSEEDAARALAALGFEIQDQDGNPVTFDPLEGPEITA